MTINPTIKPIILTDEAGNQHQIAMTVSSWFHHHYSWWVLICVCLGSVAVGLPYFSYGALLPYLSSLFYHNTGQITSSAAMTLQPVMLELGITLTGSLSGALAYYVNIRFLNFVLVLLYVTSVASSYFIDSYILLTVNMVFVGTLSGQINVCNVARLSEWHPTKSGTANGIMGFFMGISGVLGSYLCTAIINPSNKQLVEVNMGNNTETLFLDETVVQHIQPIWLAWAGLIAGLCLPGLFILRVPNEEEMAELLKTALGSIEAEGERVALISPRNMSPCFEASETDTEISMHAAVDTDVRPADQKEEKDSGRLEPDYNIIDTLKQPKFYVLSFVILTLSLTLLATTELYKIIALEAIDDDGFLNMVGASGSLSNAFGMMMWGMILDRIGTRYTFTCAFFFMGPLTISLHFTKWSRYGYLANLCSATFCTGIFTCIAPACQELFGRRDLSLKYAASLVALGFGCLLFFLLQLGEEFLFGELAFLSMIGVPCMVASVLAFGTLSG